MCSNLRNGPAYRCRRQISGDAEHLRRSRSPAGVQHLQGDEADEEPPTRIARLAQLSGNSTNNSISGLGALF